MKILAIRIANHSLHHYPYPQPFIIISIAYSLTALANAQPPNHSVTNTVPKNKESMQLGKESIT